MSAVDPDLFDLGEYFPGSVPALVADLWTLVLERVFEITVVNVDGRLFARGSFATRAPASAAMTPSEALRVWSTDVEPRLAAGPDAIAAAMKRSTLVERLDALVHAWTDFFDLYFLNAATPAIEEARERAQRDAHLVARGTRVRRRTAMLSGLADIEDRANRDKAMERYLQEFGAYAEHPELLHLPYPREDPQLVEAELALIRRAKRRHVPDTAGPSEDSDVLALLNLAEDDNFYKYEVCFAVRQSLRSLGASAVASGAVPDIGAMWQLDLKSLRSALGGAPQNATARPATDTQVIRDERRVYDLFGTAVVPGTASGQAWRTSADGDPPTRVVLITEGLGSVYAGALLPFAEALVARYGSETSHCALIARELGRPVLVVGDHIDAIGDGDVVTLIGDGRLRVERKE